MKQPLQIMSKCSERGTYNRWLDLLLSNGFSKNLCFEQPRNWFIWYSPPERRLHCGPENSSIANSKKYTVFSAPCTASEKRIVFSRFLMLYYVYEAKYITWFLYFLLHKHSAWCGKTVYYLLFAIELILGLDLVKGRFSL